MIELAPNNFLYEGGFGHRKLVITKQEITDNLEFDKLQEQILDDYRKAREWDSCVDKNLIVAEEQIELILDNEKLRELVKNLPFEKLIELCRKQPEDQTLYTLQIPTQFQELQVLLEGKQ